MNNSSGHLVQSIKRMWGGIRTQFLFWSKLSVTLVLAIRFLLSVSGARREFDVTGSNMGAFNISQSNVSFGNWGTSWGFLKGAILHFKSDLSVYSEPPKHAKVQWQMQGTAVIRWVIIEGEIPATIDDNLPELVIEIDPECGRAQARWMVDYSGPEKDRRTLKLPIDCSVYRDVAWDGTQTW